MGNQRRPLQPGEAAPAFTLPSANRAGAVSLADLRGRPFLVGFYRGLHCPFCRRQVVQLGAAQPALLAAGIETLAVINTPLERARMYFRHRPTPVTLLSDPDCLTHGAFGVPRAEFLPEGSSESPKWPYQTTMEQFMAARVNPNGEMPEKVQPMEANTVLNAKDGFEMQEADHEILANHPRSWSDIFSSTQRAWSAGFRSKPPTIRTSSLPSRPRRSLSPPRAASHTDAAQYRNGRTTSESRSTPAFVHTSSARMK